MTSTGCTLPVVALLRPPVGLAVAAGAQDVPAAGRRWAYEPKLDGWRTIGFASGLLHSRQGTPLGSRFPEIAAAVRELDQDVVVDGELVALREGRLEFAALQTGPSRRTQQGIEVHLVLFDLLAAHDRDLRRWSYEQRRTELSRIVGPPRPHLQVISMTTCRAEALEWMDPAWAAVGIEGVVAKGLDSRYVAGTRSGWLKIRQRVTTEAVVLGVIGAATLVLGRPGRRGDWRAVGVSQPVSTALRADVAAVLHPDERLGETRLPGIVAGLPGHDEVVYLPVLPEVVVEVEADTAVEFGRYRHPPRVVRIRDDLTPADLHRRDSGPGAGCK